MKKVNCLICNKELEFDYEDIFEKESYYIPGILDGVVCESLGNYGSSVFDPIDEDEILQFYICDECIVKKADKIHYFRVYRTSTTHIKKKATFKEHLSTESNFSEDA